MLDTWDLFNAKTTRGSGGSFFVVAEARLRPAAASQPQTSPFRRVFMLLTTNVENMKCYSFFPPNEKKVCIICLWTRFCGRLQSIIVSVFAVRLSTGGVAHNRG